MASRSYTYDGGHQKLRPPALRSSGGPLPCSNCGRGTDGFAISTGNQTPQARASAAEHDYVTVGPQLESGQPGTAHKAIDVDSRKFMAVKILERPKESIKARRRS
ncbi:hypothetical protein MMC31_007016, partial [Peltigera leucophlebia]|nr:hypothetical protein [Peltigera leucophlebia]